MRRALVLVASVGGLAAGVWAWFRRRRPEPATAAPEVDPEVGDVEGRRRDHETKYDLAVEGEAEERRAAAERWRADPLSDRVETPPDDAA